MRASDEAQQILSDALSHAETIRAEAHETASRTGYAVGYAEGCAQAQRELREERDEFQADTERLLERVEEQIRQIWSEAEAQIIAFCLEIAQKVIKDHTAFDKDMALNTVRNALRHSIESKRITIRVNEADLAPLRASRNDLLSLVDGIERLDIIEDRRVSQGGCVVETDGGTIDGRIETQLSELRSAFAALTSEAA